MPLLRSSPRRPNHRPRLQTNAQTNAPDEPAVEPTVEPARGDAPQAAEAIAELSLPLPLPLPLPAPRYYGASELDVLAQPISQILLLPPDIPPAERKRMRLELLVLINERGTVDEVRVVDATLPEEFTAPIVAVFRGASYSPALKDGAAVRSRKIIEINYSPS